MNYYDKYLKYKNKYLSLCKIQSGGSDIYDGMTEAKRKNEITRLKNENKEIAETYRQLNHTLDLTTNPREKQKIEGRKSGLLQMFKTNQDEIQSLKDMSTSIGFHSTTKSGSTRRY